MAKAAAALHWSARALPLVLRVRSGVLAWYRGTFKIVTASFHGIYLQVVKEVQFPVLCCYISEDMSLPTEDVAALVSIVVVYSVYYTYFAWKALRPHTDTQDMYSYTQTQLSRNLETMAMWGQKHAEDADTASVVLAVQTLRNAIVVAIFVGGAALQTGVSQMSDGLWADKNEKEQVRSIVVSVLLIISFLNWALVIRCVARSSVRVCLRCACPCIF